MSLLPLLIFNNEIEIKISYRYCIVKNVHDRKVVNKHDVRPNFDPKKT